MLSHLKEVDQNFTNILSKIQFSEFACLISVIFKVIENIFHCLFDLKTNPNSSMQYSSTRKPSRNYGPENRAISCRSNAQDRQDFSCLAGFCLQSESFLNFFCQFVTDSWLKRVKTTGRVDNSFLICRLNCDQDVCWKLTDFEICFTQLHGESQYLQHFQLLFHRTNSV